ncbi:hypothetical protein HGA88_05150 [Candidatus Roizmanbacteria bacterium]|nr:hypothetical protein [Candidatus Roizmanbacteria bacterium]
MDRIAIIGLQGAGKSTFAHKLGIILHRKVTHLDKEYYLPHWKKRFTKAEWIAHQKQLIKEKQWIIDGNYKSTIDIRIEAADTIIFFDFPKLLCIYRAFKRALNNNQPVGKVENTRETINSNFIATILSYNKKQIHQKLNYYKKYKRIIILKNSKQAADLLMRWSNL